MSVLLFDVTDSRNPWLSRRGNTVSLLVLFVLWLAFRVYVYALDWWHIMEMLPVEELGWVSFPGEFLRGHLMEAMYYFRQEPPFPQLLLGFMVKVFGWPFPLPVVPFFLSGLCFISAIFMRDIAVFFRMKLSVSTALAIFWVLSADWVSFEIDAYPKAYYESLTCFLFVFSLWILVRYCLSKKTSTIALFFVVNALMIMTRSSLSLFFLIPILISALIKNKKLIILSLIPLATQLAFSFKNYLAYDSFYFETSSFAAANFAASLVTSGHMDEFMEYSKSKGKGYCYLEVYDGGIRSQRCKDVANSAIEKDRSIEKILGFKLDDYGSSYLYVLSSPIKHEFIAYLASHPGVFADIFAGAYRLYWKSSRLELTPILGMSNNSLFDCLVVINNGIRFLNIFLIHTLFFLVFCCCICVVNWRKPLGQESLVFLYASLCFFYVSIVTSVADFSENNRYRFAVEGVIWLLPVMSFSYLKFFILERGKQSG